MNIPRPLVLFLLFLLISLGITLTFFRHPNGILSRLVMLPVSYYHSQKSLFNKLDITLTLPNGRDFPGADWYPFHLYFNDDQGFSKYAGRDLSYTVLYNFPDFKGSARGAAYYDPDSPYYSGFYGAYLIQAHDLQGPPYGFTEEGVNLKEIQWLPQYDQLKLVLPSLGCPPELRKFQVEVTEVKTGQSLMGMEDWVQVDATLVTNSPLHRYKGYQRGYLQYGLPPKDYRGEDFPLITVQGRIYARYFEEPRVTMVLYLMGSSGDFVETWSKALFQQGSLKIGDKKS